MLRDASFVVAVVGALAVFITKAFDRWIGQLPLPTTLKYSVTQLPLDEVVAVGCILVSLMPPLI